MSSSIIYDKCKYPAKSKYLATTAVRDSLLADAESEILEEGLKILREAILNGCASVNRSIDILPSSEQSQRVVTF